MAERFKSYFLRGLAVLLPTTLTIGIFVWGYTFIQEKRFDFLRSKAVLLVPLEMKTLNEQERALLSSDFTLLE